MKMTFGISQRSYLDISTAAENNSKICCVRTRIRMAKRHFVAQHYKTCVCGWCVRVCDMLWKITIHSFWKYRTNDVFHVAPHFRMYVNRTHNRVCNSFPFFILVNEIFSLSNNTYTPNRVRSFLFFFFEKFIGHKLARHKCWFVLSVRVCVWYASH